MLDTWRHRKELCFLSEFRGDPPHTPDESSDDATRKVNVVKIEITVNDMPYIAVVSMTDIPAMQELVVDEKEAYWRSAIRMVKKAKKDLDLTLLVNTHIDKIKDLEDKYHPLVVEHRKFKSKLNERRHFALMSSMIS